MASATLDGKSHAGNRFCTTKSFLTLMIALAVGSAFAAPPEPTVKVAGIINGMLNICVKKSPLSDCALEVQMKDGNAADDAYVTIHSNAVSSLTEFVANGYDGASLYYATNFIGTANLRVRSVKDGEASAWVDVGALSAYVNVKGTPIGTSTQFANAVDGRFFSMVDESTNPWLGYDFGAPMRVKRIRFFSRPDDNCYSRFYGAQIQYASDTTFSDATTVFTSSAANTSRTAINELVFDEPISAICLRVVSAGGSGRSSLCEFEVVPADVPYHPSITVEPSDITNFYPVVTWSVPSELAAS